MASFLPLLAQAGISGLGAAFGGSGGPSSGQERQSQLIDQLLASLRGEGPFSDLFQADEGAFNRSFVEPARARFRNVTAPSIQQSFISQGQQRGTGLEDTLTRAGVDMDALLNQAFLQFQQGAQNRQLSALSGILGAPTGPAEQPGFGEAFLQGIGGSFASKKFGESFQNIFDEKPGFNTATASGSSPSVSTSTRVLPKGFTR